MEISEFKAKLKNGKLQKTFSILYGSDKVDSQTKRYIEAIEAFQEHYQAPDNAEITIYSAPGRTEIIGNHTDHQQGQVIAASVGNDTIGIVMKQKGNIEVKAADFGQYNIDPAILEVQAGEKETTSALIRGIAAYFASKDYQLGGLKVYTTSNVLKGSGLSSSAAFESLIGTILSCEYNGGKVDAVEVAIAGQYAENVFFGKPCGLMDQLASSFGGFVHIDFEDAKHPAIQKINFDISRFQHSICVVDTGGNHADLTDDYASIPAEMKQVANALGANVLGEVSEASFMEQLPMLRGRLSDRALIRAFHFYGETRRVAEQAVHLKENQFEGFMRLIRESGQSSCCYLQNVFSTKAPDDQGLSLALALTEEILQGKGAYRVHGGGFGGTILAFIPNELLSEYQEKMGCVFGQGACAALYLRPIGACRIDEELSS